MQKQKHTYYKRTIKTEEEIKKHSETAHRDPLPMWCKGIMGGCVNCGGCI